MTASRSNRSSQGFSPIVDRSEPRRPDRSAGPRMFWKKVRSRRWVPEMVKVESSRWTPKPILLSMIEEFRAKTWMRMNSSVMSIPEVYNPGMMYSKLIVEEGAGTVSRYNVIVPKKSRASRRAYHRSGKSSAVTWMEKPLATTTSRPRLVSKVRPHWREVSSCANHRI